MVPPLTSPDTEASSDQAPDAQTQPLSAALVLKLTEFDVATEGLQAPVPGSKIAKRGDQYYFLAPGYTQGLFRWLTGESQDTTKQYIEELAVSLVALTDEAETMLGKLGKERQQKRSVQFGRTRHYTQVSDGLRGLVAPTPESVEDVATVLAHIDTLSARVIAAVSYVDKLYATPAVVITDESSADRPASAGSAGSAKSAGSAVSGESYDADEPASSDAVFSTWKLRLIASHTALCAASASFRG